jgi:DNA repair protein RadC
MLAAMPPDPSHGHRKRLRERFLKTGLDGFAEHEVLELLLTLCVPRRDVKPPARQLIQRFGSLKGVMDAPLEQLRQTDGIGEVTPVALRIIKATMAQYLKESAQQRPLMNDIGVLIDLFRTRMAELPHEVFEVAYLDKRYFLLPGGIERLESGLPDRTTVYPRKVMQTALQRHASYLVVAHNHPSGQLQASPEDKRLTEALVLSAQAVGLKLLDHLIITPDRALSFVEEGLLCS